MSQFFVGDRVGGNRIRNAVMVTNCERARRAHLNRLERIPDTEAAQEVSANVTGFDCPTALQLALDGQVPLLSVRRISITRRTSKRRQIDRTVSCRAAVIQ